MAELQVLAGGALTAPMNKLAADYEKASGRKLAIRFGTTPVLIDLALHGGAFDLGVVPVDVMKDPSARARFAPGPTTDIARVGLGVAVRTGARKPEIGTVEAFKRALLEAGSIATIPASAGGTQVLAVFEALGIGEVMKAKLRAQSTPAQFVHAVSAGEAEVGLFLRNVLTAQGLDLVGPVPPGLHNEVVFTAALAAEPEAPDDARAFIAFLRSPATAAFLAASGLTPA